MPFVLNGVGCQSVWTNWRRQATTRHASMPQLLGQERCFGQCFAAGDSLVLLCQLETVWHGATVLRDAGRWIVTSAWAVSVIGATISM